MQSQVRFNRVPEKVPVLGFAARFRKIGKIKRCGCWGYHRSLLKTLKQLIIGGHRLA